MNAMLSNHLPLPSCLVGQGPASLHRRHHIDGLDLTDAAVERFNRLLERFGQPLPALDPDRVATAARELCAARYATTAPACIRQRLRRVKAARYMLDDPQWHAGDEAAVTVRVAAAYVAGDHDLIPDALPLVGRLDDAIVIDAAWPHFRAELADYLDFRRLRRMACPPGLARSRFDRQAWQQARMEEARLLARLRAVRESSFIAPAVPVFHVF